MDLPLPLRYCIWANESSPTETTKYWKSLGPSQDLERILQVTSRIFFRSNLTMIFYNAFYVHPILLPSFQLNWLIIHDHVFTKRSITILSEIPGIYSILSLLCKDKEGTCQLEATLRHLEIETVEEVCRKMARKHGKKTEMLEG